MIPTRLPAPLNYAFPRFIPGRYAIPPDFQLWPEAFFPELKSASLPSTPPIPPNVATGDVITAGHENTVSTAINDLWVNEQWLAANSVIDPTTATGDIVVHGSSGITAQPVGANGTVLTADSTQATGLRWTAISTSSLGAVPTTRQVIAGAGMTGGGALSADVTLTAKVLSVFGRSGAIVGAAGDYTAAQVTNAADTTGAYANPAWITSLAWGKLTGIPPTASFQTPWVSDIDGAGHNLTNAVTIGINTTAPIRSLHVASVPNGGGLAITGTAPCISLSNADTEPNTNTMTGTFGLATAAGNYSLGAGDLLIATQGSARGNIYISPNYAGGGTARNVYMCSGGGGVGIGTTTVADALTVVSTLPSGVQSQIRMVNSNYGVMLRNDDTNLNLLLTNSGSAYGGYNALRPFAVNLSSGAVTMAQGALVGTSSGFYSPGDLGISRNNAPTTGAIYFGNSTSNYLYFDGTTFNLAGGCSCNNQLAVNGPSKATAGNMLVAFSSVGDGANPLQAAVKIITDPTAANRRLSIFCVEQNVAYQPITLNESGSGNIGIWTSTPGTCLSLGQALAPIKLALYDATPTGYGLGIASGQLTFGANINMASGTPQMVLTNTGALGLGTTSPPNTLSVASYASGTPTANYHGTEAMTSFDVPGNTELAAGWLGAAPYGWWIQVRGQGNVSRPLALNPAGGNVGIGTNNPTSPLHVVGLPTYASDAAAGTAGLTSGAFYIDASGGLHAKL
jgi:hypothetical protein